MVICFYSSVNVSFLYFFFSSVLKFVVTADTALNSLWLMFVDCVLQYLAWLHCAGKITDLLLLNGCAGYGTPCGLLSWETSEWETRLFWAIKCLRKLRTPSIPQLPSLEHSHLELPRLIEGMSVVCVETGWLFGKVVPLIVKDSRSDSYMQICTRIFFVCSSCLSFCFRYERARKWKSIAIWWCGNILIEELDEAVATVAFGCSLELF